MLTDWTENRYIKSLQRVFQGFQLIRNEIWTKKKTLFFCHYFMFTFSFSFHCVCNYHSCLCKKNNSHYRKHEPVCFGEHSYSMMSEQTIYPFNLFFVVDSNRCTRTRSHRIISWWPNVIQYNTRRLRVETW